MFGWLRRRSAPPDIPQALWDSVQRRYPFIAARPRAERDRLRELAARFLATKEFHGAKGFGDHR